VSVRIRHLKALWGPLSLENQWKSDSGAGQKAGGCCTEAIGMGQELPHSDVGCNRQCKDGVFQIEACESR